jgi:hypothetical protein
MSHWLHATTNKVCDDGSFQAIEHCIARGTIGAIYAASERRLVGTQLEIILEEYRARQQAAQKGR